MCIIIPVVYFVTSLAVDYALFYSSGVDAFTESPTPYDVNDPDATPDPTAGMTEGVEWIWLVCGMINVMALLMALFFVFDVIQKERDALEGPPEEQVYGGAAPPYPAAATLPVSRPGADADGSGHAAMPRNAAVLLEEGQNASHLYGDVHTGDLDAPKTVQDKVERRDKLRLIRRFFYAFCFYCEWWRRVTEVVLD